MRADARGFYDRIKTHKGPATKTQVQHGMSTVNQPWWNFELLKMESVTAAYLSIWVKEKYTRGLEIVKLQQERERLQQEKLEEESKVLVNVQEVKQNAIQHKLEQHIADQFHKIKLRPRSKSHLRRELK